MTSPASATVVAELTPPGRGAVAVVVVAGPESVRAVDKCFIARSGRAVGDIPLGRIALGQWGGSDGEELVLIRRDDEQIEVHCHGGIAAVEAVIGRLASEGCQKITWQEWIERCSSDPIAAAAQTAVADAVTERTAGILLDQLNGALTAAIREIVDHVATAAWSSAAERIDELLGRRDLGLHLTHPWRVVVVGAPNVGKSSLMNALAGYERAIVSTMPGTTRDVVSVTTAMDGWPVHLSDTAGFRETQDELESAGIKLATTILSGAELAIFVHDAAQLRGEPSDDRAAFEPSQLAPHVRGIHVVNKIDLISTAVRSQVIQRFVDSQPRKGQTHAVSALTGEGIAELISIIAGTLVPTSLPAGTAVPFTFDQVVGLAAAGAAVERRDANAANESLHAMLTRAG